MDRLGMSSGRAESAMPRSRVAAAGPPRFVPRRVSRDKCSSRRGRSGAAADRPRQSRSEWCTAFG